MAFKMKKPSMTQGTAKYKAACDAMQINREMDASSLPDGRAKSSAFQKADPYAEAKKKDPNLDQYIKERKNYKAGSEDYEKVQAKINKAYGKERDQKLKAAQVAKSDKEMGTSKSKAGEESLKSTMTKETDKGKNKTVTTTKKADEKGSSTEVVKDKKNKTKTTTVSKDDATGKETKITSKVKKDKEGNVRKEKDTVVADGNVSKTTTKYDKEGNVKKSKVKNRKTFGETRVGKFLSGKKNKGEKPSAATKDKTMAYKYAKGMPKYSKSMATKPEDLEVGNRKNLPDALKSIISAAPKYAKGMPKYAKGQAAAIYAQKAEDAKKKKK